MSRNSEYRFEDSPGLKHSCGICGTPLNHPRAKKTCYGKHAEPCARFHHTMFRIGRGTSCDACNTSNEQHLKRHREIAAMIRELDQRTVSDEEIYEAIHGYSEDLVDEDTNFMKRRTVRDLKLEQGIRLNQGKSTSQKKGIGGILNNLGIEKSVVTSPKKGATLISRLENAIVQDITISANESRGILKRQLGYYRYADWKAFQDMFQSLSLESKASSNDSEQFGNAGLFHSISVGIDKPPKDQTEWKSGKKK